MTQNIHLLIIDPQLDFISGSLPVKGADKDMERLAAMINRIGTKIKNIHVTLDTHRPFDIAHPLYWIDANGRHPAPFTIIKVEDIENNSIQPSIPDLYRRSLNYVKDLKANNRYDLCIWPEHVLLGTEGHNVYPLLMESLLNWEQTVALKNALSGDSAMIDFVMKGMNPYTEHYSAIEAEVQDSNDVGTLPNIKLINSLNEADVVVVAGEAGSHCVRSTVNSLLQYMRFTNQGNHSKIVILEDAMSPVPGFEKQQLDFFKYMSISNVSFSTTKDFLK
jgi:nicotinamidase-related amidase